MQTIGIYEIAEELGRGAVGVVYRGYDPAIGRPVAIKVMLTSPFGPDQDDPRPRFEREGAAAGRLSHPNIVTIYQLAQDGGSPYLAMEFVDGPSLEKGLVENRPIAPRQALEILSQVAAALDYAHRAGVIHRDIKPSNILIGPDGRVKLTDFGVARITTQPITQSGLTMGTPAYIAPEQVRGDPVDGRADQFSLGVMAYQMLTGRKPFRAPSEQAVLSKILEEEPPAAHEANRHLPESCSAILARALAKDPEARFPDCTTLVEELRACLLSPRKAQRRQLTPAEMPPVPSLLPKLEERGFGRAAIVAVTLLCAGLAVAAYLFSDWTRSQERLRDAAIRSTLAMAAVDVFFDPDSAQLSDEAVATLARNASRLRKFFAEYPVAKVRIEGHTDDDGSAEESRALASRRAGAAAAELTKAGIPPESLAIVSVGRDQPQCTEPTEACRAKNNRVHFSLSQSQR